MSNNQRGQQQQQQQQRYHDPPGGKEPTGSNATTGNLMTPLRRDDAPALKRYDPSVLVPSDARSVHVSQLPQRASSSSSFSNTRNPNHARSSKPLQKALPRMKKGDEKSSETSIIKSFHGEEMEPTIIRLPDGNDARSVLKPYPGGGDDSRDGTSILKVRAVNSTEEGGSHNDEALAPSIAIGDNFSVASSSTMMGSGISPRKEYGALETSVVDHTIQGIVEEEPFNYDPNISETWIDDEDGKRPFDARNTAATLEPIIVPLSATEPVASSTEVLTATIPQLDPSAAHVTSNSLDTRMIEQLSISSQPEPKFRVFPKDPSVVSNGMSPSISIHDEVNQTNYNVKNDKHTGGTIPPRNANVPAPSQSHSVNLVRKNSPRKSSSDNIVNNTSSNGHVSTGNYFERSLIEEFNHLIEEEQRDSSVMSIPMVPALLDDATTLVSPEAAVHNNDTPSLSPGRIGTGNIASQGTNASQAPPIRRQSQSMLPRQLPMRQLSKLRQDYGLPVGCVMEVARYQKCAYTYFVCDTNNIEDDCIRECAHLTATAQSEIVFCVGNDTHTQDLLYPPPTNPELTDIQRQRVISDALRQYVATIRSATWSTTPTTRTIQKLFELAQLIPRLQHWQREKVAVVIFTNRSIGINSQAEFTNFINGIKALQQIRVQISIRLATFDGNIVDYYNRIKQSFPSICLLSTFEKQRALIQKYNPWLNYGEPLHRLRELGYHFHNTIEWLSQRKLSKDELRVFFVEFYGKKAMLYCPDLYTEWDAFYRFVDTINNREGKHKLGSNPKNREHRDYWINIRKLDNFYSNGRRRLSWRSRSSIPVSKLDKESLRVEL